MLMPEELAAASKDRSSGMTDVVLFFESCSHARAMYPFWQAAARGCLRSHTQT